MPLSSVLTLDTYSPWPRSVDWSAGKHPLWSVGETVALENIFWTSILDNCNFLAHFGRKFYLPRLFLYRCSGWYYSQTTNCAGEICKYNYCIPRSRRCPRAIQNYRRCRRRADPSWPTAAAHIRSSWVWKIHKEYFPIHHASYCVMKVFYVTGRLTIFILLVGMPLLFNLLNV